MNKVTAKYIQEKIYAYVSLLDLLEEKKSNLIDIFLDLGITEFETPKGTFRLIKKEPLNLTEYKDIKVSSKKFFRDAKGRFSKKEKGKKK